MQLEVVRMVKAALADADNGYAAQVALLTIEPGDPRPRELSAIYGVDDSNAVATDDEGRLKAPALIVAAPGATAWDGEFGPGQFRETDGTMTIAVSYFVREYDKASQWVEADYVCRALARALANTLLADPSAYRRNGVQVETCDRLTVGHADELFADGHIIAVCALDLVVVDTLANTPA